MRKELLTNASVIVNLIVLLSGNQQCIPSNFSLLVCTHALDARLIHQFCAPNMPMKSSTCALQLYVCAATMPNLKPNKYKKQKISNLLAIG